MEIKPRCCFWLNDPVHTVFVFVPASHAPASSVGFLVVAAPQPWFVCFMKGFLTQQCAPVAAVPLGVFVSVAADLHQWVGCFSSGSPTYTLRVFK